MRIKLHLSQSAKVPQDSQDRRRANTDTPGEEPVTSSAAAAPPAKDTAKLSLQRLAGSTVARETAGRLGSGEGKPSLSRSAQFLRTASFTRAHLAERRKPVPPPPPEKSHLELLRPVPPKRLLGTPGGQRNGERKSVCCCFTLALLRGPLPRDRPLEKQHEQQR